MLEKCNFVHEKSLKSPWISFLKKCGNHDCVLCYGYTTVILCNARCISTHWGWMMCQSMNWVSIGSGNGLLPSWHQAITLTNADLLWIRLSGTNFSEILIKIQQLKMHLKVSSAIWRPFCSGFIVLNAYCQCWMHITGQNDDQVCPLLDA